jgi:4-methylaminobutanoate oxidase (formaldehyde-forming)
VWGADITPDDTPLEAGLGFCVRSDKTFLGGADAVREVPPRRRLRCLVLDDPRSVALGNEPVRVSGEVLGRVTSGGYGYTVERSIAYAYLPVEVEAGARVEVDGFGAWVGGEVTPEPLYDPGGARVRD